MDLGRIARYGYPALAILDTFLAGRRSHRLRYVTKPLLMPTLTVTLLSSTGGRQDVLRNGTVGAHAFSWGGDIALLGRGERAFLLGLGSFYAAHVSYIAAFWSSREQSGVAEIVRRPGPRVAAVVWLTAAPALFLAAGRQSPRLRLPVAAYAAVLAKMFAVSTMLSPAVPISARRSVVAGTALFLASDTTLAVNKFLGGDESPTLRRLVMATYTAGQWLISEGVRRAR